MFRHRVSVYRLFLSMMIIAAFFCLRATVAAASQAPANNSNASAGQNAEQTPATPAQGAADSPASTANPPTAKPKKVWTNEDVSGMSSTISVVGNPRGNKSKSSAQSAPPDASYISSTRTKLEKLRSQIAEADKQLAVLKDFASGEPVSTSDREFHKNYGNQPIAQQMDGLQAKKKDLQSQIDALLDEARKKGVEPGQLR